MTILYTAWPMVLALVLIAMVLLSGDDYTDTNVQIVYVIFVIGLIAQLAWIGHLDLVAGKYTEVRTDRVELTDEETNALLNNITIVIKYKGDELKVNPVETGITFNSITSNYVGITTSKNKFDNEKQTISIHLIEDKNKFSGLQPKNTE